MFHSGDLQSGIALAIQNRKSVACFVRDSSEESQTWEDTWLQDEELTQLLNERAVLLRLEEGSQEAGFLAAFCPLKEMPTLVVIHDGRLKEHISSPVDQEQFKNRLIVALDTDAPNESAIPQTSPPTDRKPTSTTTAPNTSTLDAEITPRNPEQILADHQARVERERIAREARQKTAAQEAKAAAQRPTGSSPSRQDPSPQASSSTAKGKQKAESPGLSERDRQSAEARRIQQLAAEQARKQKLQREIDLARVQARIKQDQEERRAHQRERERDAAAAAPSPSPGGNPSGRPLANRTRSAAGKNVSLQVRLFDGSTMRASFPSSDTLASAVRVWVDKQLSSSPSPPPYTFRHMQTPLPAREIGSAEESEALAELGLYPSATLVLVPVAGYSFAYAGGPGRAAGTNRGVLGSVQRGTMGVFGMLESVAGAVAGTLRQVPGMSLFVPGEETASEGRREDSNGGGSSNSGGSSTGAQGASSGSSFESRVKIRTLADQRREEGKDDTKLYNGNQLDFEPRDDDKS